MCVLRVFYETDYETRKNIARTVKINYHTSKKIIADLEQRKLIEIYATAKRGICYKITAKGADTYQKAREAYHNVGIELK